MLCPAANAAPASETNATDMAMRFGRSTGFTGKTELIFISYRDLNHRTRWYIAPVTADAADFTNKPATASAPRLSDWRNQFPSTLALGDEDTSASGPSDMFIRGTSVCIWFMFEMALFAAAAWAELPSGMGVAALTAAA